MPARDLNSLLAKYQQRKLAELGFANQPQVEEKKSRGLIEQFAPTIGGIAGSILGIPLLGPAGIVAGGAAGNALGELFAQKSNDEDLNVGKIAGEAALGGFGGFIGKGLGLGKAAAQAGKVAKGAGKATEVVTQQAPKTLERGIGTSIRAANQRGAKNSVQLANQVDKTDFQKSLNLKGSNLAQEEKALDGVNILDTQIRTILRSAKENKKLPGIATMNFNKSLTETAGLFDDIGNKELRRFQTVGVKELRKAASSGKPEDIYNFKSRMRAEIDEKLKRDSQGRAINTLDTRGQQEIRVKEALYRAAQKTLDEVAPNVRELNRLQSGGYQLIEDLAGGGQFFGREGVFSALNKPAQIITDSVGRGVQAVESIPGMQAAGRTVVPAATGQIAARAPMSLLGGEESQAPETMDSLMSMLPPTAQTDPLLAQEAAPQSEYPIENYLMDIQRDPKNASIYEQIYESLNPEPPKASAATQKSYAQLQTANNIISQLKGMWGEVPHGGAGGVASNLGNMIPGFQLDPKTAAFEGLRRGLASQLARAIAGEMGVITDQDIQRILSFIPSSLDNEETAMRKFQSIDGFVQASAQGLGAFPSGNINTEDILSQLGL